MTQRELSINGDLVSIVKSSYRIVRIELKYLRALPLIKNSHLVKKVYLLPQNQKILLHTKLIVSEFKPTYHIYLSSLLILPFYPLTSKILRFVLGSSK